jgi:hypothetical protein
MVRIGAAPPERSLRASVSLTETDLARAIPRRGEALAGNATMVDISTPVSFAGFTRSTIERFSPQLRAIGLEPLQGVSGGGRVDSRMGNPSDLKPGAMISVQLMTGDLSMGADGTVTHIDGNRVYAFGHRFLSTGPTSLPFARSEVVTLLPVLSSSFKISTPRELMGVISQDRNTAIAGELGRRAPMVPLSIAVSRGGRRLESYNIQMVNDRFLSPLLTQMAVFSTIDATERTVGVSSFLVKGQIEFQDQSAPITLNNMFAADTGSALQVSLFTAVPLAYVLQGGFENLHLKNVALEIESFDEKKQLEIDQVNVGRRQVRPGDQIELTAVFSGENGAEIVRRIPYQVPRKISPGPLFFTVADGVNANLAEFRQLASVSPRSPAHLISIVNKLRANTKAYVRVWRSDPAFLVEGEDFPDPPPSLALIFSAGQAAMRGVSQTNNSKIAELEISAGDVVISGSKTVQVEVKE